ncbi:MAG: DJ-1/PfpI family protein [Lachnospiraceae bacterium]|nr:DJ-1/PfpI family protein [Lachnospiraceae bacterium]
MAKIAIFMANGCEEIEALTVVDLLRRAGISIDMLDLEGTKVVRGAHGITIQSDGTIDEADAMQYDGIVLPGGMPGTTHLKEDERVCQWVREFAISGKLVAAICAAPTVLGHCGILKGKKATCYPGCEDGLNGANFSTDSVVIDGNIVTSRGMGTAIDFGLALITYLLDEETSKQLAQGIVYRP